MTNIKENHFNISKLILAILVFTTHWNALINQDFSRYFLPFSSGECLFVKNEVDGSDKLFNMFKLWLSCL